MATSHHLGRSDTAYLDHCNFKDADLNKAYKLIATAMPRNFNPTNNVCQKKALKQELKLELLEISAPNQTSLCNFLTDLFRSQRN